MREDRADIALTFSYPGDRDDPHGSERPRALGARRRQRRPARRAAGRASGGDGRSASTSSVLAGEKWIAGCPRCRGHLLELCARAGFEPHIAFETDNFVAVEGLVAQGIGVATLPRMAVASFPQLPGVVTLPLPPAEARTIHVVTAHGADRVPAIRATLDAIARCWCAAVPERSAPAAATVRAAIRN